MSACDRFRSCSYPAGIVSIVLAEPIVRLVYQRGAFDPEQTTVVAGALAAFAAGLVFNGWMLLLNRAFYSLQNSWIPTVVAGGNLALNIVLYSVLYRVGVWGIPLSVSIANLAGALALFVLLRPRVEGLAGRPLALSLLRIASASRGAGRRGLRHVVGARLGARRRHRRPDRRGRRCSGGRRGRLLRGVPHSQGARARHAAPATASRRTTPDGTASVRAVKSLTCAVDDGRRRPRRSWSRGSANARESRENGTTATIRPECRSTRHRSATSRSSRTSTTASRRLPTVCCSSRTRSASVTCATSCSTRWTSSVSAASRSRRKPCASTGRGTSST